MVVALLAAGAGPAAARGSQTSASVTLSSRVVGKRPVAVKLRLGYEMQCGYPGPGPIVVVFPKREHVPKAILADAVLVDGKHPPAVGVSGRKVTVELPPPPQVMCDVIAEGHVTIAFTKAARLGNPGRAGEYAIVARRGKTAFHATYRIRKTRC